MGKDLFLEGQPSVHPKEAVPALHNFGGSFLFIRIELPNLSAPQLYTFCHRTTKLDVVTCGRVCNYRSATSPIPWERSAPQFSPYLCLQLLTQNDQIRHGNTKWWSQNSTVQDQDLRFQVNDQDKDFTEQDQDRDQDSKNWVSRRLGTKTWVNIGSWAVAIFLSK